MRGFSTPRLAYIALLVPVIALAVVLTARFMGQEDWVTVATTAELEQEEVIYSEDLKIFVVERKSQPLALSANNPHLGTYLMYCPSSGQFQGRHGEKFDRFGVYYGGPSPRNMDRVEVRVFGDEIQVLPDEVTRGARRPRDGFNASETVDPIGRFCPDSPSGAGGIYQPGSP